MIKINFKNKEHYKNLQKIRKKILIAGFKANEGHIPSGLSILEIIYVLYKLRILRNFKKLDNFKRDRFILSKGHGSLAIYGVLNFLNLITDKQLYSFCKFNSKLGGHPDRTKSPYLEVSTGSLGHGLPIAVGLAYSLKKQYPKNSPKVFCLIGDGEANEGTTWETLLFACSRKINNLIIIIDFNLSGERAIPMKNINKLFSGFNAELLITDGHDINKLYSILTKKNKSMPKIIIAKTIKGKGVKLMENNPVWHHKSPNESELDSLIKEL